MSRRRADACALAWGYDRAVPDSRNPAANRGGPPRATMARPAAAHGPLSVLRASRPGG